METIHIKYKIDAETLKKEYGAKEEKGFLVIPKDNLDIVEKDGKTYAYVPFVGKDDEGRIARGYAPMLFQEKKESLKIKPNHNERDYNL